MANSYKLVQCPWLANQSYACVQNEKVVCEVRECPDYNLGDICSLDENFRYCRTNGMIPDYKLMLFKKPPVTPEATGHEAARRAYQLASELEKAVKSKQA